MSRGTQARICPRAPHETTANYAGTTTMNPGRPFASTGGPAVDSGSMTVRPGMVSANAGR